MLITRSNATAPAPLDVRPGVRVQLTEFGPPFLAGIVDEYHADTDCITVLHDPADCDPAVASEVAVDFWPRTSVAVRSTDASIDQLIAGEQR